MKQRKIKGNLRNESSHHEPQHFKAIRAEVEVDDKTSAAIDRGVADAREGRVVSLEEVRKLVPQWIPKFESQKPR
jgi:predicted transcriptional regulator